MTAVIRIEIFPPGLTRVAIAQPRSDAAADHLWGLYRALRPQIAALEQAARREGARANPRATRGER